LNRGSWLLCLWLTLPACRSAQPEGAPSAAPARTSSHAPAVNIATNRDRHGNPDVEQYLRTLVSEERIARFQIPLVLKKLALKPDARIGDLGCGPGIFAEAFAQQCPQGIVYASDVEPRQLDALRERMRAHGLLRIVPVLSSYESPHFPPGELDLIFIADTYHHLEDRVNYMRALRSALKPDGRVAILDYKPGPLPVGPKPDHKLKVGELDAELRAAGYQLLEAFPTHPYHDFQIWMPIWRESP
jgi:SAM-dependent methyltransferase